MSVIPPDVSQMCTSVQMLQGVGGAGPYMGRHGASCSGPKEPNGSISPLRSWYLSSWPPWFGVGVGRGRK